MPCRGAPRTEAAAVCVGGVPGTPEQPERKRTHDTSTIVQEIRTGGTPFVQPSRVVTRFSQTLLPDSLGKVKPTFYVVPLGISRGEVRLLVIARKIAVSLVMFWFVGAVASQPSPSSE